MTLGLSMIVRDAERDLPACLASAAPWVDDIVVADTGSRDRTPECARALGARVFDISWQDDFAAARNQALTGLTTDWVLVLDADERFDPGPDPSSWRAQLRDEPDAFQVTIRNYVRSLQDRVWDRAARANPPENRRRQPESAPYPAYIEHENVRLFRRRPELYFVGRLHESVGPRVAAAGLRLGHSSAVIHHYGLALDAAAQAAKNHHYRKLARIKAVEQPADYQAHFELGVMEFDNFHDDPAALLCFERCLRLRPDFALAWFYGGAALLRLGHAPEAGAFFRQAAARGYDSPLLEEMLGDAAYNTGDFAAAAARYGRALSRAPRERGLRSKLGLAQVRAGRHREGLAQLRAAAAETPEHPENAHRLQLAEEFLAATKAAASHADNLPEWRDRRQEPGAIHRMY